METKPNNNHLKGNKQQGKEPLNQSLIFSCTMSEKEAIRDYFRDNNINFSATARKTMMKIVNGELPIN